MAEYNPILFPPPKHEDSAGTPDVENAPTQCTSQFYHNLERLARRQQAKLLNLTTQLRGYEVCIFNPVIRLSEYDDESQSFAYKDVEDYEGLLMIKGLHEFIVMDTTDQWTAPSIIAYWNDPPSFDIKENAKIIVHTDQRQLSFKVKYIRKQVGQFIAYRQILELIPFE